MITEKVKAMLEEELKKSGTEHQMENHLLKVHKYAMKLMEKHGGDKEIIELAVWLHDITRLKDNPELKLLEDHHITGAEEAGRILKELGYPEDRIKQVQHCIMEHRTGRNPETIEAKILSVADAMSHFDVPHYFMWIRGKKGKTFEEAKAWASRKINSNWENRLPMLEGARDLVRDKYEAFKALWGEK